MKARGNLYRIFGVILIIGLFLYADGMAQPTSFIKMQTISGAAVPPARDTTTKKQEAILVDLLNSSLQSLADKDRQGRMTGGYVLLGLGAGSAAGGAVTLAVGEGDDARIVGYSLLGGGVLLSGLSLLPFKIKSESERLYTDFRREIEEKPDENRQIFYYWDRRFEELAQKRKRERVIGGVSSIVAGGLASMVLVEGSDQDRLHTFIWPAIGGITSLLVKSEEERRYETYQRAKMDIMGRSAVSGIHFGIIPLPKGGILSAMRIQF